MKFLFASDSFKGSLTGVQASALLCRAAGDVFPGCTCATVPVADGGEGTTDAVIRATHGTLGHLTVCGPLGEPEEAFYGALDSHRAIMEMAAASALPMVPPARRDPLKTTSYGTGQLLNHLLDSGYTDISVALGGSATNDGGMGFLRALGVKFYDDAGHELPGRGADLIHLHDIDISHLNPRLKTAKITAMCDVTNPLCGPTGATYTFGAQKGGTQATLDALEAGMQNYRALLLRTFGTDPDTIPGSGAAGGMGAALSLFLSAPLKRGIETVLDLIDFDSLLTGVSLVVTGEGQTDAQSCFGKVIQGIGRRCKAHHTPAVALVGSLGDGWEQIYDYGILSLFTTTDAPMPLADALADAEGLYYRAALRMFKFIKLGTELK